MIRLRNKYTGKVIELNHILTTPMKERGVMAGWRVTTDTYVGEFYHCAFWEEVNHEDPILV